MGRRPVAVLFAFVVVTGGLIPALLCAVVAITTREAERHKTREERKKDCVSIREVWMYGRKKNMRILLNIDAYSHPAIPNSMHI